MCGIAGFTGAGSGDDLRRMTDALIHRGPDAEGHWSDPSIPIQLGHRRLSIIDLEGGAQPMLDADRSTAVVFNGEIYNHAALRADLESAGYRFQTDHSDTEVLLHGYRHWGADLPEKLNGMWAFAILDRTRNHLFLSRDRFGKKPLFYHHDDSGFRFASELTSLGNHPAVPHELDPVALKKYFGYGYIPAPLAIWRNVRKLSPGSSAVLDLRDGSLSIRRYWEFVLNPEPDPSPATVAGWEEELRATLEAAVRRRLMSDVPLGVFLSGGIDSSAVAALAARHLPEGRLNTFAIGFTDPAFDESDHARAAADLIGARHHEKTFDLETCSGLLPEIARRLDEPMGDSSLLPTSLLCGFARTRVTVALGGDGGDELFAGYDPFQALRTAEIYARLVPKPVHQALLTLAARLPVSHANLSADFKIKRFLRGLSHPAPLRCAAWMSPLEPREIGELLGQPADPEEVFSEAIEAWDAAGTTAHPVDRTLQFFTRLYLASGILAKTDRASMMHGLEARSPFLDVELADLAARIPHHLKFRNGTTKYILKRALAPILPHNILHRRKKGFGIPIGRWIKEGAIDFSGLKHPAPLDPGFVAARLKTHKDGRTDERLFLWNQWLLSSWLTAQPPHAG